MNATVSYWEIRIILGCYKPILTMNEGYADVAYEETPEFEAQKRAAINQRLNLINLPSTLKEASLAKVES